MELQQFDAIVLSYSPGPFEYTRDSKAPFNPEDLSVSIASRIRYSEDSDYVGFQIDLMAADKDTKFLKTGFVAGLMIKGWSDYLQNGGDLSQDRSPLNNAASKVWDMAIGIVASQTATEGRGFILPPIPAEKIAADTILNKQAPINPKD